MIQLYREHNGVIALHYTTLTLIWLGVIISENFMEDKLTMLHPLTGKLCLFRLFSVKINFNLN